MPRLHNGLLRPADCSLFAFPGGPAATPVTPYCDAKKPFHTGDTVGKRRLSCLWSHNGVVAAGSSEEDAARLLEDVLFRNAEMRCFRRAGINRG